jgi:L-cystine uptake protein TcyP (sodium:dicarboxylate symporter family)
MHRLRAAVIDHCSKLGQVQPTLVWLLLIHGHCTAACGMLTAELLPLDQQTIVLSNALGDSLL